MGSSNVLAAVGATLFIWYRNLMAPGGQAETRGASTLSQGRTSTLCLIDDLHCPKSSLGNILAQKFSQPMGTVPVLFKKIYIQQHPRKKYL
jgi:hypothetical protein